ncbi:MAG: cysteine desulfurase [Kiritimatiellia bacterium]
MQLPVYLDHHATTPCDERVLQAMLPWFSEHFGNAASRTHTFGMRAKSAVELARERVAELIGCSPKEVVWTSGATESDNLAVLGVAKAAQRGHIITTTVEHKAVLDPCVHLQKDGFDVTFLPVDEHGRVTEDQVAGAFRDDTVLVSIMMANNEVGTLQPVAQIGALCRARSVPLHVDAAQAAGHVSIDVVRDHIDLLSLSAHKMYGPKGIGALYVRRGRPRIKIRPLLHGGGHERGLRPGTLPVPLIVGMGEASKLALSGLADGEPQRLATLRDRLWMGLDEGIEDVQRNGAMTGILPHNLNISISNCEAEALMMNLRRDVAMSSGSACSSATLEPSYVLRAMGLSDEQAYASIRFGLGRRTNEAQVDHVVNAIIAQVQHLRALRS